MVMATLNFVGDLRRFSIPPVLGNTRIGRRCFPSGPLFSVRHWLAQGAHELSTGVVSPALHLSQIS